MISKKKNNYQMKKILKTRKWSCCCENCHTSHVSLSKHVKIGKKWKYFSFQSPQYHLLENDGGEAGKCTEIILKKLNTRATVSSDIKKFISFICYLKPGVVAFDVGNVILLAGYIFKA